MNFKEKIKKIQAENKLKEKNLQKFEAYKHTIDHFLEQIVKAESIFKPYREKLVNKKISFDLYSLQSPLAIKHFSELQTTMSHLNKKVKHIHTSADSDTYTIGPNSVYPFSQNQENNEKFLKNVLFTQLNYCITDIQKIFKAYLSELQEILKENESETLKILQQNIPAEQKKYLEFLISLSSYDSNKEFTFNAQILSDYEFFNYSDLNDNTQLPDNIIELFSLNINSTYHKLVNMDDREDKNEAVDVSSGALTSMFNALFQSIEKYFGDEKPKSSEDNINQPATKGMFEWVIDQIMPSSQAKKEDVTTNAIQKTDVTTNEKQVDTQKSKHQFDKDFSKSINHDTYRNGLDLTFQKYIGKIAAGAKLVCYSEVINANQALTNCQAQYVTSNDGYQTSCKNHYFKLEFLENLCEYLYPFDIEDTFEQQIIAYYESSSEIRYNEQGDLSTKIIKGIKTTALDLPSPNVGVKDYVHNLLEAADGSPEQLSIAAPANGQTVEPLGLPANDGDDLQVN